MRDSQAMHEDFGPRGAVKTASERSFGIVFAAVFAVVGVWPLISGDGVRWWALGVAAVFLSLAFIRPAVLAPLNKAWMKFGEILHKIVSPVIMGLLFYLTVTPVGLVMRIFKKDPLGLDFDKAATSYWIERDPPGPKPETMRDQF